MDDTEAAGEVANLNDWISLLKQQSDDPPAIQPMAEYAFTNPVDSPWLKPRAAYIHVPFCGHHCGYCDFAVAAGQDSKIDLYLEALEAELSSLNGPQPVETIFLGGGTPTHLSCKQLARLLTIVHGWLLIQKNGEFSTEANPGTLTEEKIAVLAEHGVNRISLGSQSFQPHLLEFLEREHLAEDIAGAVEMARKHIEQVSLDLIFGVPGQTLRHWQDDLKQALSLQPDHVSTYGLTYEKGTRLWKQLRQGQVQPLAEEAELEMYLCGIDTLTAAGFEHYEISNFARPHKRSRHNQVYWANHAYFGFGMGAARYIDGKRELNTRSLEEYIRRVLSAEPATFQSEVLSPEDRARETITLNLRRGEGVRRAEFRLQTGFDLQAFVGPTIARHVQSGHLEEDEQGIRLTRQGKCVADYVIAQFWKGTGQ